MTVLATILWMLIVEAFLVFVWVTYPRSVVSKRQVVIHHHDWSDWSEWVEEPIFGTAKRWNRQRVCHECGRSERREVGRHDCTAKREEPCPHRAQYAALLEDKITRLERELGPWGNDK